MEERCRDDCSSISNFNPVTKVEPNDDEYILCGEFVEVIPSTFPTLFPPRVKKENPLALGIIGDNPFGLKRLEIKLEDCLHELLATKIVKKEPEEKIYEDSEVAQRSDDGDHDKEMSQEKNKQNHHELEANSFSSGKGKGTRYSLYRSSKSSSPVRNKWRKTISEDEVTTSSESDNDESYNPRKSFKTSVHQLNKKHSTVKKRKLNKSKNQTVKSFTVKEKVNAVLWSCCSQRFEEFSALNEHKVQKHQIEELQCSNCTGKIFSSFNEIKKHYLDFHTHSAWKSFDCLNCSLVFGVKSSYLEHKIKCSESQMRKTNTAFRLSCCQNIIRNFEDFFVHKVIEHKIAMLTCGLCFCEQNSETQLRIHYQEIHFSKFCQKLELENQSKKEGSPPSILCSSSQEKVLNEGGEDDNWQIKYSKCTALQDGILCQCFICEKRNERQSSNDIAEKIRNESGKRFVCKTCNLRFRYNRDLQKHLNTHKGLKLYPCNMCNKAFTQNGTLKTHVLHHHSVNPFKKETCSFCKKRFFFKYGLEKHIRNTHFHLNKIVRIKCEYCEKTFAQSSSHRTHMNQIHLKEEEFICEDCGSIFHDKNLIRDHIEKCHIPKQEFICATCGHVVKSRSALLVHFKNKHSKHQYSCEVCGKIVRSKEKLKQHLIVHSDENPFTCETCGKRFKRLINLNQHQYTHSDSRPYTCNICGQTFRLRTHVKQHMAVHGIIKNHKCFICDKTFARKSDLKNHISLHDV